MKVVCATCGSVIEFEDNTKDKIFERGFVYRHVICCEDCAGVLIYKDSAYKDLTNDFRLGEWEIENFSYNTKVSKGSEKQIEWANRIKFDVMRNTWSSFVGRYANDLMLKYTQEQRQTVINKIVTTLKTLENCNEAKFWIDNRESYISDYVKFAIKLAAIASKTE